MSVKRAHSIVQHSSNARNFPRNYSLYLEYKRYVNHIISHHSHWNFCVHNRYSVSLSRLWGIPPSSSQVQSLKPSSVVDTITHAACSNSGHHALLCWWGEGGKEWMKKFTNHMQRVLCRPHFDPPSTASLLHELTWCHHSRSCPAPDYWKR